MERKLELLKEVRRTFKAINMAVPTWVFQVERELRLEKDGN